MFIKVGTGWVLALRLWFKSSRNSPKAHLNVRASLSRHLSLSIFVVGTHAGKRCYCVPGLNFNNLNSNELFSRMSRFVYSM